MQYSLKTSGYTHELKYEKINIPTLNNNNGERRRNNQQRSRRRRTFWFNPPSHLTLAATSDSVYLCRHHTDYMRM